MKHLLPTLLVMLAVCLHTVEAQDEITIHVDARPLAELITAEQQKSLQTLNITGELAEEDYAFLREGNLPQLRELNLRKANIHTIPKKAFYNYGEDSFPYKECQITLPEELLFIGDSAFYEAQVNLILTGKFPKKGIKTSEWPVTIIPTEDNAYCLLHIGENRENCILSTDGKILYHANDYAYYDVIPEGVEIIAERAFEGNRSFDITFPQSLKKIEDYAFYDSYIVVQIGSGSPKFTFLSLEPPTLGKEVFSHMRGADEYGKGLPTLSIPEAWKELYTQKDEQWKIFKDVEYWAPLTDDEKEPEEAMPSRPQPALPAGMEEVPFGEALYLMNVGTKQFFTGGGQWETQAYAGEEGWKVRLKKHQKAGVWDGKTVVLEDSIVTDRANGWRKAYFYTHGNAVFTDGLSQADTLWVLHQMGGGRYRLSASQKNMSVQDEGRFVGVDGGSGSMALTSNQTGGNAQEMVDWIFLDKTGYEACLTEMATYRLAQELKQLIDEAAAKGIDVTPQDEVYQDPTASAEEIEKACAAVRQLLIADEEKQVKADNPADKTSWITNDGYADKKAGWSDTDDRWTVQDGVAEHYGHTFNHYQTISDIPNGLYKVTVQGVYRAKANAGHPEEYAAFYAISGNDSIAKPLPERRMGATEKPLTDYNVSGESYGYVPTAPSAVDAYFKAGKYEVEYYIHVVQNKVRLGVTLPDDYATDWVVWDNWRLTYYGTDTEAYEKGVIAGMAKENMDKYDHLDAATTIGTVDAYKAILTSLAEGEVADINVAEKRIKDAAADVEKNSQAWASYREVIRQAELLVGSPYIVWNDICRKLDDYLKTTVRKHLDERTLTSEEVNKAALELDGMRNDAQSTQATGNNIKKTWSYVRFDRTGTDEYGNRIESNDYNRYTLFTIPENVGRTTYHKLVNHQTCEYDQEKDAKTYRIRYEGKRIYLLKEDAPDYQETGILLKEEGDDYILYDFGLEVGDEFCKMAYDEDTVSIYVTEISSVATTDGEMRRAFRLSTGPGWIIDGIGSTEDFIHPTGDMLRQTCDCGVVLNLYRESLLGIYPRKEYRNPFGNIIAQSTTFKEDDCALGADAVEQAVIQRTPASVQATGSAILCTATDAVKLEVYTMDAVKVGETLFANGTATVKVSKAPAMYLYIVTYRDGRRESGKVVMSK